MEPGPDYLSDYNRLGTMLPLTLNDEEMVRGYFDVHYAMAGLDRYWRQEYFLDHVLQGRRVRVEENLPQIRDTLAKMRTKDYAKVPHDADLLLNLDTITDEDLVSVLIWPDNPRLLANLIYSPFNRKNRRSYKLHKPRRITVPPPRVRADWPLPIEIHGKIELLKRDGREFGSYASSLLWRLPNWEEVTARFEEFREYL